MCVLCAPELPTDGCIAPKEQAVFVSADVFEDTDATSRWDFGETNYTLSAGDTFFGHLWVGDFDAFTVDLEAGTTYTASLEGSSLEDLDVQDTILLLVNETGTVLEISDDIDTSAGNYYSQMNFTVGQSGSYKLVATSFNAYYNTSYAPDYGYYELSFGLAAPEEMRNYSVNEIADYLTYGGWGNNTYRWNISAGDTITVNVSGLTADGQTLAFAAMEAWTAVTGIEFAVASSADITFIDHNSGAYASFSAAGGYITNATVNVSTSWVNTYGTSLNGYSFQTYIHEIGHALGLAHGGNYNGSATYGTDNHYYNDSWQLSVMSYFNQVENSSVNASYAYVVTPQQADIRAAQDLYGVAGTLRTGDTTYGNNSNVGGYYDDLGTLYNTTFTILDNGGTDTLDFSEYSGNQKIYLEAERFSSVRGETNNLAISRESVIENAVTGSGDDLVYGNAVANRIEANAGDDTIYSGAGDDIVFGGVGADRIVGEAGNDTLYGGDGDDIIKGREGDNTLYGEAGEDKLRGSDDGDDTIYGGDDDDKLIGLDGGDRLEGGDGRDYLYGGRGNDVVIGGDGDDIVRGNRNDDLLNGEAGTDKLFGGGGNDTLDGGKGRDFLLGENGDDSLDGGIGDDNLTGGGGSDIFVFAGLGYGYDRILDFESGVDQISFGETSGFASFSEVVAISSDITAGLKINFGNGDVLLVEGFSVAQMIETDFLL